MELTATKLKIEKFFFTSGTNIALRAATRRPTYRRFRDRLEKAYLAQVKPFEDEFLISQLLITEINVEVVNRSMPQLESMFIFDFLKWGANKGGEAALNRIAAIVNKFEKAASFDLENRNILAFLAARADNARDVLQNTSREWVVKQAEIGFREGLTSSEIADMITEKVPSMAKHRAEAAAHTELANAMGTTSIETYKRNGLEFHTWQTSQDDRVSDVCVANGEQDAIPIGNEFVSGATHEPQHVRCRCWTEPHVPDNFTFDFESAWKGE